LRSSRDADERAEVMGMTRNVSYNVVLLFTLTATALFTGGCGDDDDDNSGDDDGDDDDNGAEVVDVTEDEFEITTSPDSVPAGMVEFVVENVGEELHEFIVVKTDLAEDELPLAEEGGVDEESDEIEVIDEIEEVETGETETLTLELDSGDYVLICNRVVGSGDAAISHYELGMHVSFTVE
jgi:uncharacterized cupredoxin-like copper-binding protein